MKLTPQHITKTRRSITAWRIVLGSKKARQSGLLDEHNKPKDFVLLPTANGVLLATKDEYIQAFEHRQIVADVYRHTSLFFGEIPSIYNTPTFFATSLEKAEQAFRKTVDSALDTE